MKKQVTKVFIMLLMVAVMILQCTVIANAASSNDVKMSTTTAEIEKGKEIDVLVSLANINVGEGVNTLKGTVNYDTDILEYVNSEAQNGWSITYNSNNGTLLLVNMSGLVKQDQGIAKITFKVKDTATEGDTTVKLTNIESSNADEKVNPADSSVTIKVIEKQNDNNDDHVNDNNNENNNNDNNIDNNNNDNNNNGNVSNNNGGTNSQTSSGSTSTTSENGKTITTTNVAETSIPKTGVNDIIIGIIIAGIIVVGIISFVKYRKYRGI